MRSSKPKKERIYFNSKIFQSLWQYYRDEPFLDNNGVIADILSKNNNSASFKYKTKIACKIGNNGKKDVTNQGTIEIFK